MHSHKPNNYEAKAADLNKKLVPFIERSNRGAFVDDDFSVADNADNQLVAEGTCLTERVAVAVVHHVKAAVHVNADRSVLLPPPWKSQRKLRAMAFL